MRISCALRPRVIKEVHQQRISPRDHMRALANVLQHIGLDLDMTFPEQCLQPLNPLTETRLLYTVNGKHLGFIVNKSTGQSRWDTIPGAVSKHTRLTLSPDEGGPLYCVYIHLASNGAAINFVRDELFHG